MKKLFIYYSLSGNGDMVADYLLQKDIDTYKVKTIDRMPKNILGRMLKGGFLATINHKAKLVDLDVDLSLYDEIIIGSPIWNGRLSCPINTVLDLLDLKDKKVTFILYSGSGKENKAVDKINRLYKTRIINITEPRRHPQELDKLNTL